VQTAVILVSYINKLRLKAETIRQATREASLLRLRPIMMTALVACLGLLPPPWPPALSATPKNLSPSGCCRTALPPDPRLLRQSRLYEVAAREGDRLQV